MAQMINRTTQWPADLMEQYCWIDELLLKQKATVREFNPAWQAYKYMLRDKMYAYIGINDQNRRPIITLKLEPAHSEMLRKEYADIVAGYYMNKVLWSTVYLDGEVSNEVIADMICASHRVLLSTFSKKVQREISESS